MQRERLVFSVFRRRLSPLSKIQCLYPFHLLSSLLSLLPPSDILLTHNCGSPPPIAGINPHLRPPRHTVCSPTMHLSSKTFPDTFGLLSIAYLSLPPSSAPFISLGLPIALHRPVSFALPLSSSNSLNFPFLSLYSATACQTKVSPNLPQSPFDIKWRLRNRPMLVVLLTVERRATLRLSCFMKFFFLERLRGQQYRILSIRGHRP